MVIPARHPALVVDGKHYDLSHLDAYAAVFVGKGRETGTDLPILVMFSNHVFTERTQFGDPFDTLDHHETKRSFDPARFNMSLRLPTVIRQAVQDDALCFVSKSFGGNENLMLIELENNETWSIVFCFEPLPDGVVMEILSTHPRAVSGKHKHYHLSYHARRCLFQQSRVPKS